MNMVHAISQYAWIVDLVGRADEIGLTWLLVWFELEYLIEKTSI